MPEMKDAGTDPSTEWWARLETPAQRGQRLADESFAPSYRIKAAVLQKTIRKALGRRVRLPRARGSMKVKCKIDLTPLQAIAEMAEKAGFIKQHLEIVGRSKKRKWTTDGPKAAVAFAALESTHPLAWGGAKLTAPAKGAKKKVSRVMTLLAPPISIVHTSTPEDESTTITGHLVTYTEEGTLTLPPKPELVWGEAHEATKTVLTKYAKKMLGDLFVHGKPISQTFKQKLGKQYASSDSEVEYSEDSA